MPKVPRHTYGKKAEWIEPDLQTLQSESRKAESSIPHLVGSLNSAYRQKLIFFLCSSNFCRASMFSISKWCRNDMISFSFNFNFSQNGLGGQQGLFTGRQNSIHMCFEEHMNSDWLLYYDSQGSSLSGFYILGPSSSFETYYPDTRTAEARHPDIEGPGCLCSLRRDSKAVQPLVLSIAYSTGLCQLDTCDYIFPVLTTGLLILHK